MRLKPRLLRLKASVSAKKNSIHARSKGQLISSNGSAPGSVKLRFNLANIEQKGKSMLVPCISKFLWFCACYHDSGMWVADFQHNLFLLCFLTHLV